MSKKEPLLLWGGTDVDATLYNEKRDHRAQHPDTARDARELALITEAVNQGRPIIGVCRGAQLLCVANGGSLYQHSKPIRQQHGLYLDNGKSLIYIENIAAGHHQIMRPTGCFELVGYNPDPVEVWVSDTEYHEERHTAEIVWYPKTKCLAIQPHPEWEVKGASFIIWLNAFIASKGINYEF